MVMMVMMTTVVVMVIADDIMIVVVHFKVGGPASDVKYLVLQVHFLYGDDGDNSGGRGGDHES